MAALTVGTRVVLTGPVERYPHFIAPAGATGVVTDETRGVLSVRMDEHLPGAEDWDNEIVWDCSAEDPLADLRVITPAPTGRGARADWGDPEWEPEP